MFTKVINAEMAEPHPGIWGITRGSMNITRHRAVCISLDGVYVLAHYMYDADAAEISFTEFVNSIRLAHSVTAFTLMADDPGTIDMLRKANVGHRLPQRLRVVEATLLVPPDLFRYEVEPFFGILGATAGTAMDHEDGLAYL